jgi:hypothetical protein
MKVDIMGFRRGNVFNFRDDAEVEEANANLEKQERRYR